MLLIVVVVVVVAAAVENSSSSSSSSSTKSNNISGSNPCLCLGGHNSSANIGQVRRDSLAGAARHAIGSQ